MNENMKKIKFLITFLIKLFELKLHSFELNSFLLYK